MSNKASKTIATVLAAAVAVPSVAVAGGYPQPAPKPTTTTNTNTNVADSSSNSGANASARTGNQTTVVDSNVRGGDQNVRTGNQTSVVDGNVRGGDQNVRTGNQDLENNIRNDVNNRVGVDVGVVAAGGGGGAGGQGGAGGNATGGNAAGGNAQAEGGKSDQQQSQQTHSGVVDNRSETTTYTVKHKVGVTSETVRADGACKKGFGFGVGGDFGFSASAVDTNTKCLDKVQQHEKDLKIMEQGPEGTLYVIKADSLKDAKRAEAFNTVGEAHFKATQTKGAGQPSLGQLWQNSRPSYAEGAAAHANERTGRNVRVVEPVPAPTMDR